MYENTTVSTVPREFTPREQALRLRAQQRLTQQRLNARTLDQKDPQVFRRAPCSTEQPATSASAALVDRTQALATEETILASIEAAMERLRRPRQGSPAALAFAAVERIRPILEARIKRREARENALIVYRVMVLCIYTLIQVRGQSHGHTTTYTFFTVLDLLPRVTGLSSDQCERATRRLQDIGLIHKTSGALPTKRQGTTQFKGGTWVPTSFSNADTGEKVTKMACAGTWVAVILRPSPGIAARVISHELPPCPRDLTMDRKTGRTAWQEMQKAKQEKLPKDVRESMLLEGYEFDVSPLIQWSLQEANSKSLVTLESRRSSLVEAQTPQDLIWGLSAIVSMHPTHRRQAVQEGAARLVELLDDAGSERHYYRVLWRATEAEFRGYPAYTQLAYALQRTLVDKKELHLTRPGAWLMRLLRRDGWLDAVYHVKAALKKPGSSI